MTTKPEQAVSEAVDRDDTNIVALLREYAAEPGYSHGDYADVMRRAADDLDRALSMFMEACADLGEINEALGLDPDDGGAEPILAAIEELRASRPSPDKAAPEWMPIGSAPKDGTQIIVTNGVVVSQGWWEHEEPYVREQRDMAGVYIDQQEHDGFDGWLDCEGGMKPDPTHWQPLPPPPDAVSPPLVQKAGLTDERLLAAFNSADSVIDGLHEVTRAVERHLQGEE